MEKEANVLKSPPIHVRKQRYYGKPPTGSLEAPPEQSNLSGKRKTAPLSLFYPPPRPSLEMIKPSPELEFGYTELKGDTPVRPRPCKCKQSSCVKMYCWCFASGKYCDGCSCSDCQNNVEKEEARQAALGCILERNSKSLRTMIISSPKCSVDNKDGGKDDLILVKYIVCCCKRSQCIQGYCECYQAKMFCSESCKCKDCHNFRRCGETSSKESKKWKNKENFPDSNMEDQLNSHNRGLGQSWKIVRRTARDSLNVDYRSLLADIMRLQNLAEFCKLLMVTSESVKFLADSSGIGIDVICGDSTSDVSCQKEIPTSPETVPFTCDEKNMFPPDASSNRIQSSCCYSDIYMEQEKHILAKFRDFLHCLITCGNAKELELSARIERQDERETFCHKFVLQNVKRRC